MIRVDISSSISAVDSFCGMELSSSRIMSVALDSDLVAIWEWLVGVEEFD